MLGYRIILCLAFILNRNTVRALTPRGGPMRRNVHAIPIEEALSSGAVRGRSNIYDLSSGSDIWKSLESCEGGGFGVKPINTMDELVSELTTALRFDMPLRKQTEVKRTMMRAQLPSEEYTKFAFWDPVAPYTRNLVATDYENYVLLLLCWSPGKVSKVHDHPCDGCWMRVIEGDVEERLYEDYKGEMVELSKSRYAEHDVAFVDDNIGLHSIGNPFEKGAMTLHLYSPPIENCKVWPDLYNSEDTVIAPMNKFYSEFGSLVERKSN